MYENEEKQYPLLLDFGFAYDMVIDYADYMACIDSEKVTVKCLNCGEEYTTFRKYVNEDDKGTYVTCKCCGATCDIDL
jgi:transcription elongation factor Elf1